MVVFVMMHETFIKYEPLQNKIHSSLNTSTSHMTLSTVVIQNKTFSVYSVQNKCDKISQHINKERLSYDELFVHLSRTGSHSTSEILRGYFVGQMDSVKNLVGGSKCTLHRGFYVTYGGPLQENQKQIKQLEMTQIKDMKSNFRLDHPFCYKKEDNSYSLRIIKRKCLWKVKIRSQILTQKVEIMKNVLILK